jgi:C4-dicarboxylate transporter DctM subunit
MVALSIALLFALLILGVPIGLALIGASFVGMLTLEPGQLGEVVTVSINSVNNPTFVSIPLFVMAGAVIAKSGFMDSLLYALAIVLRPIRGGLTLACLGTAVFFAGATGSSAGESAALASSFYQPMRKRGYPPSLTAAIICSSAAAGVLVPPSVTLIIYGTIANYPVQKLWLAGIAPAVVSVILLGIVSILLGRKHEVRVTADDAERDLETGMAEVAAKGKARLATESVLSLGLPVFVLVGIYTGKLTITETAAVAIAYVLIFGAIFHHVRLKQAISSLNEGAERAAVVFLIFIGAHVFTYYLTLTGVATNLVTTVTNSGLPRDVLLILLLLSVLVLGSLMDGLSVLIIATPLLTPLLTTLDLSPVQLGVMLALAVEVGVVHPPVGMNLFTVSSVTDVPVGQISLRVLPFVAVLLTVLAVVTFAPLPFFSWR